MTYPTNPDRVTRWPRLPWPRSPEWRPAWKRPEPEERAERLEALWAREPMPPRVARRLIRVAHFLEQLRDGPEWSARAIIDWMTPAEIERAKLLRAEENAAAAERWNGKLTAVDRALAEIERDLDAALSPPQPCVEGDRANVI
jgi:hypothetical protein